MKTTTNSYFYKTTFLLFLISLFYIPSGITQPALERDSLIQVLKEEPNNLAALNNLAQSYEQTHLDSARFLAQRLIEFCDNDPKYISKAYNTLGNCALSSNDLEQAVLHYQKAVDIAKKQEDLGFDAAVYQFSLAQAYLNQGETKKAIPLLKASSTALTTTFKEEKNAMFYIISNYGSLGDAYNQISLYDLALENLLLSLKYAQEIDNPISIGLAYNSIASIYSNLKNYDKSIEYNRLALGEFEKFNYPLGKATVFLNLAESLFKNGDTKQSLSLLEKSKNMLLAIPTEYNLGEVYRLYGNIYFSQQQFDASLKEFEKALQIHQKSGAKMYIGKTQLHIAKVFYEKKEDETAEKYAIQALEIFEKEELLAEKLEGLALLIQIRSKHNPQVQNQLTNYLNTNDKYLNTERQKAIANQEIKYETQLKESKIIEQQLENERQKSYIFLAVSGAGLILLLSLGGYLYNRYRQRQKEFVRQQEFSELKHNMTQLGLSNLNNQINSHDFKNTLTAALNEVQEKAPASYQHINDLLKITESALYTHSFTDTLDNQLEQIRGLVNLYKNRLFESIELQVENNIQEEIELPRLLLKNLVENALKHGIKGTNRDAIIQVKASKNQAQQIEITVQDNGRGLPEKRNKKGKGISVYQELFTYFNPKNSHSASIELQNANPGTKIKIIIPNNYQYH